MAIILKYLAKDSATSAQPTCTSVAPSVQQSRGLVVASPRNKSPIPFEELPDTYRKKAMQRMEFVRSVLAKMAAYRLTQDMAVAAVAAAESERFPDLLHAGKHGASALTLKNFRFWFGKVKTPRGSVDTTMVHVLADKTMGCGRTSVLESDTGREVLKIFARFYEHENRLGMEEAYRLTKAVARKGGMHPECIPELHTIKWHYKYKVDQVSVLQARMGRTWAENNLAGYITRDWETVEPGEIWFGDHHQFDVAIRTPDDSKKCGCRAERPWLTAWMDARSRFFIGWIIRVDEYPDSRAIEEALLDGTRKNGNRPPVVLYTDNGKDYKSKGFTRPVILDDETMHSIGQELGCQHVFALPYNARAKTIERAFREVAQSFARWFGSFRANCPNNRPEGAQYYYDNPEGLPSLQEFTEAFAYWVDNVFHAEFGGNSRATGGRSPQVVWDGRNPNLRPALTDRQLYFAFLKPLPQLRLVGRGGRIAAEGKEYQTPNLWSLIGKKVLVKVDRADSARIHVFREDGGYITEALQVRMHPVLATTDTERDALSAAMADNRRLLSHSRAMHRERTGEVRIVAPMDRLQLSCPDVTPAKMQEAIGDGTEPRDVRKNSDPDTDLRAACEEAIFGKSSGTANPNRNPSPARKQGDVGSFDFSEPKAEPARPAADDAERTQMLADLEEEF